MVDIKQGVELFNDADFFAAHDFFETLWVESNRDDRLFFQGLVQISVGCYHLICGNLKGARNQFIKGTNKLKKYSPAYYNLELEKLLIAIESLTEEIDESLVSGDVVINLNKIPKLESGI